MAGREGWGREAWGPATCASCDLDGGVGSAFDATVAVALTASCSCLLMAIGSPASSRGISMGLWKNLSIPRPERWEGHFLQDLRFHRCVDGFDERLGRCCWCARGRSRARGLYHAREHVVAAQEIKAVQPKQRAYFQEDRMTSLGKILGICLQAR